MKKWLYKSNEEDGVRNLDAILILTIFPTLFYIILALV